MILTDIDIYEAVKQVLFDNTFAKRDSELDIIRRFIVKYRSDKGISRHTTALVFKDYLVKNKLLKYYMEDRGSLFVYITIVLYHAVKDAVEERQKYR